MQVPGGYGVTCLGGAIATSVVSLLIEPAHDRRCRVKVFEQQQGQEGVGCGFHTIELLVRLLPAFPVCGENPHHPMLTALSSLEMAQRKLRRPQPLDFLVFKYPYMQGPQPAGSCLILFSH